MSSGEQNVIKHKLSLLNLAAEQTRMTLQTEVGG
jgi:hypothetical protein